MRYVIPFCAAALLTACSGSPTSPTAVHAQVATTAAAPPQSTPGPTSSSPSALHWDRIGAGCPATDAPRPLPSGDPSTREVSSDGSLNLVWWPYTPQIGRDGMLSVRFVPQDGAYLLCWWDMSDL